jgi:hypothetical protein
MALAILQVHVVLKLLLRLRLFRHWSGAVFGSRSYDVCRWLWQLLLWGTRWSPAASHFYFGQFSFFSAQILSLMVLIGLSFIDRLASAFSRFFDRRVNLENSRA